MTLRDSVPVLRVVFGLALFLVLAPATGQADCNGNGVRDSQDIESGMSPDCNGDLVPDECEQSVMTLGQLDTPLSLPFVPEVTTAADLDGLPLPDSYQRASPRLSRRTPSV